MCDRARMSRAKVVAIANQKGGVGKSTMTMFCARSALTHYGCRVLVVDMDPSGNVTTGLLAKPLPADGISLADALAPSAGLPLREVIVPTIWDGVDLAPAAWTLTTADQQVASMQWGREHRLRDVLEPVLGDYDLILIDNAPSLLGMLLVNSLSAADTTLLVTEPATWSSDGLALLARTLDGVRRYHNPQLGIVGCAVNMWAGTNVDKRVTNDLITAFASAFPDIPVWTDYRIPRTTKIRDAVDCGVALDQGDAKLRVIHDDCIRPITGALLGRTAA